jgi:MFS family permease
MAIGWILAGGKLTMALSQGYVGTVSDRIGKPAWFVFTGTLLYGLGTLTIPFAGFLDGMFDSVSCQLFQGDVFTITPPFVGLFLSFLTLGIADSIRIPPSIKLFVEEGEQYDAVAGSLSLRSVSWQVGAIVGPVVVGFVLEVGSFFSAFGIASALVIT